MRAHDPDDRPGRGRAHLRRRVDASRPDADDAASRATTWRPRSRLTVVLQRAEQGRLVEQHRWGLVPSFAKSLKDGAKRINARAETVATSPSFRSSFRKRRCIVPSDGFYEWRRTGGPKQPYFRHPPDDTVLAMAGVWAVWKDPETGLWVPSAAVITTDANHMMSSIHDRMPVLLPRETWEDWLDPDFDDTEYLSSLLQPAPDDVLGMFPISTRSTTCATRAPSCWSRSTKRGA